MGEELAIRAAAKRLGVTEWAVRKAVVRGELRELPAAGPARLDADEVARFGRARQAAALERFTAKGTDLVQLAVSVRSFLRPYPGDPRGTVSTLGADVVAVFGPAALHAAGVAEPACSWCASVVAAGMLGTDPPAYGDAMVALLGKPCARDMERFARTQLDALAVRVHAPTGEVPARRAGALAPQMRAESRRPVREAPAVVQPIQGDADGRDLVASRLRETRAKLTAARRAGDRRYEGQLRLALQSLTADASVVDGRTAAPRGRKACGTPVGVRCECHVSDRRGQR
jgi:hypothetical protein